VGSHPQVEYKRLRVRVNKLANQPIDDRPAAAAGEIVVRPAPTAA
jgi:hypothetical protein